jgi:hypothetical protein
MSEQPHISFLWQTKLKSRNCFLTIMEYMQVPSIVLRPFLSGLNQQADPEKFYESYVQNTLQFSVHEKLEIQQIAKSKEKKLFLESNCDFTFAPPNALPTRKLNWDGSFAFESM